MAPQTSFFLFGLSTGIAISYAAGCLRDYLADRHLRVVKRVPKLNVDGDDSALDELEVGQLIALSRNEDYFNSSKSSAGPKNGHSRQQSTAGVLPITGTSFTTAGEGMLPKLETMFYLSAVSLQHLVKHLIGEMTKGLKEDGHTLKMLPSYVFSRPDGNEVGNYLALDVGGSTMRVCEVELNGLGTNLRLRQASKSFTAEQKMLPADELFDIMADLVAEFIGLGPVNKESSSNKKSNELNTIASPTPLRAQATDKGSPMSPRSPNPEVHYKLGFTFSFPIQQTSLTSGTLLQWNKGFGSPQVLGADVVALLKAAFDRRGIKNVEIAVLLNDAVGTLISQAFKDQDTYVGVIIGTGTNAAYVESLSSIPKLKGDFKGHNEMIINTEWGAYNEEAVLQLTPYDLALDRASTCPKKQMFEKMFSGMYLGEIVRYILVDLASSGEVFKGKMSDELRTPYKFDTMYMSRIERDHTAELSDVRTVLESLMKIPSTTLRDRKIVKHICELVGIRAARLAAAGVAAIVTKIHRFDACTVAVDGSVFQFYPHFANRMRDALKEILGLSADNIILEQARDGSGLGSALTAAAVSRNS